MSGTLNTGFHDGLGNNVEALVNPVNGRQEVDNHPQDQDTPPVEYFLTRTLNSVTILNPQTSRENTLVLAPGHGVVVGDFIQIHYIDDTQGPRYSQLLVVSVVGDTIRTGSFIGYNLDPTNIVLSERTSARMNVVGTIDAPVKFEISPPNGTSQLSWDLTRLIVGMVLDGNPDDSKFGDIVGGVTNGIFFGVESDTSDYYLVNIRVNAGFRGTAYDVNYVTRSTPQGGYGLSVRKSFNGMDKYGVVVRLVGALNEKFVVYVQDDLSQFVDFGIKVMGHIVED